jgi:hypothetical protein
MVTLRDVVQKFPKEEVSELASAIVKGLDEGRLLMDDRYDASSIWSRRARTESNDSTGAVPQLSDNRYSDFCFVLAYPTGGINENMLVFEMAHYNFTNYTARNFDIEIQADAGLSMMIICILERKMGKFIDFFMQMSIVRCTMFIRMMVLRLKQFGIRHIFRLINWDI